MVCGLSSGLGVVPFSKKPQIIKKIGLIKSGLDLNFYLENGKPQRTIKDLSLPA